MYIFVVSLTCLIVLLSNCQTVLSERYVCFDQQCVGDINNASPQCHKFCNELGYTFGHCSNRTLEENPDYERLNQQRRRRRQVEQDLIASILNSGAAGAGRQAQPKPKAATSGNGNSAAALDRSNSRVETEEKHLLQWQKFGDQCQCYSCHRDFCNKYCESKSEKNCQHIGQVMGFDMDICGCAIELNSAENLLDISDTLC